MKNILTNWDKIIQILTIVIAFVTVLFAYLSARTSEKLTTDQINFSKELNKQEIMLGRPIISCTGNISIFDEKIFNLNILTKNIGKRSLSNLSIEYWVFSNSSTGIVHEFHEKYLIANPLDNGFEQVFFERLPRSNSTKDIYYKLKLRYDDILTQEKYEQEFYYIFPKEQQEHLDNKLKETVVLIGAAQSDKLLIDKNLNKNRTSNH